MTKIARIEKYLFDFFSNRWQDLDDFYRTTHDHRHMGIYQLKDGPQIMDLIISIHGNIEEQLYAEQLIPNKFVTPEALLRCLDGFKKMLNNYQPSLSKNYAGENTNYIAERTQEIVNELVEMVDYVKRIYDEEDTVVPYQELRYSLTVQKTDDFIRILKSILASVSYAITKVKEGYFHSNVHLILKLLGFDIVAEEMSNMGRIDAVIRLLDLIYILEFKFDKGRDASAVALQQIKDKHYAEKFAYEKKTILLVGVSFDVNNRNINGHVVEKIPI